MTVKRVLPGGLTADEWAAKLPIDPLSILRNTEVSVTTTANLTIGKMHVCSGTSADYTVTLPAASGNAGKFIGVRISTACTKIITVDGDGSETIDGATTRLMWAGESAILMCDGTGWTKISGKTIPFRCKMHDPTGQNINDITETKITIDTAISNGAHQELMADTVNNKILIKRTGVYRVRCRIYAYNVAATYSEVTAYVKLNTSTYAIISDLWKPVASNNGIADRESLYSLTAGDYLELNAYVNTDEATAAIYGAVTQSYLSAEEVPSW